MRRSLREHPRFCLRDLPGLDLGEVARYEVADSKRVNVVRNGATTVFLPNIYLQPRRTPPNDSVFLGSKMLLNC